MKEVFSKHARTIFESECTTIIHAELVHAKKFKNKCMYIPKKKVSTAIGVTVHGKGELNTRHKDSQISFDHHVHAAIMTPRIVLFSLLPFLAISGQAAVPIPSC